MASINVREKYICADVLDHVSLFSVQVTMFKFIIASFEHYILLKKYSFLFAEMELV